MILLFLQGVNGFELLHFPMNVSDEIEFPIFVLVENEEPENYSLYSYIYRGSKCYSGRREANMVNFTLSGVKVVEQHITPNVTEPGEYKLMVKLKAQDKKSWKKISQPIKIESEPEEVISPITANCSRTVTRNVIYESSSVRAAKLAPLFFMVACSVLSVGVLFMKKKTI